MRPILKTGILSKANLDQKILFGKVTHHLDSEIRKTLADGKSGNDDSTFHSGP